MGALKEYDAVVNGVETTLVLSEEDAKGRGLSAGRDRQVGESDDSSIYDDATPVDPPAETGGVGVTMTKADDQGQAPADPPADDQGQAPADPPADDTGAVDGEKAADAPNKARGAQNKDAGQS